MKTQIGGPAWLVVAGALVGFGACSKDKPHQSTGATTAPIAPQATSPAPRPEAAPATPLAKDTARNASRLAVTVDGQGYHPPTLAAPAGQRVQLVFTRTTEQTCGKEVVFPSLEIRQALPLNQPVTVDVTVPATGTLAFTCGMNMFRGSIVPQ